LIFKGLFFVCLGNEDVLFPFASKFSCWHVPCGIDKQEQLLRIFTKGEMHHEHIAKKWPDSRIVVVEQLVGRLRQRRRESG
jgi:hypothetical protein